MNKKLQFLKRVVRYSKKIIKIFWMLYAGFFLLLVLLFFFISRGWLGFMPSFEELENPRTNLATEVYSEDGELLGKYYIENRSNCDYSELSPMLLEALLATEDIRFISIREWIFVLCSA